jgi:haloalkane dehalogenase
MKASLFNQVSMAVLAAALTACGSGDSDDEPSPAPRSCKAANADAVSVADIESKSGVVLNHPAYGDILRTPKARFDDLPDYPFSPRYADVDGAESSSLYMHYIDEGPRDGRVVLMIHGNPAWSYLVRDHVKPLADAGYRVIAIDMIGFGKSDKPAGRQHQTYANQTLWVNNFVEQLGLCNATMFIQDWGGLIGLRVAMTQRARFTGMVLSNGALPDGTIAADPQFIEWRDVISQQVQHFSEVLEQATPTALSAADLRAYDAPYPSNEYTAGPRQLPSEVPFDATQPEAIANKGFLQQWSQSNLPLLTVFSDPADPNNPPLTASQRQIIDTAPGAAAQPHVNLDPGVAAHFISEDAPAVVTDYLLEFLDTTRPQ